MPLWNCAPPAIRGRAGPRSAEDAGGVEYRPIDAHALHRDARGRAHGDRAAGAAADRAGHELLQRHLAGQSELGARRAAAASIGVGPQANSSTCASAGAASRAPARRAPGRSHSRRSSRQSPTGSPGARVRPISSSSGMQPMASSGMPGTRIVDGRTRNGNGTSEPISTSGLPLGVCGCEAFGQKHHRRDADAAAERQHARPLRMRLEAAADRAEHAQGLSGLHGRQRCVSRCPTTL